jgi:hypothetical protein
VAWALHYGDGVFKTLTMDRKYAEDEWGKDMATPLVAAPPHPAAQSHRPDPHDKSGTVLVAAPSPPTAQPPQQWREIGSAPKPEIGEDRVFIVLRDKFGEAHVGFWTGEDWSGPQFGVRDPTHWVPLPEPTKETR